MGIPVRELMQRIDSDELTYWMAYDRLDPIGNIHHDYNSALIALNIAQVHAKKGKRYKISDFMLDFEGRQKLTDPKDLHQYFKTLSASTNGRN